MSIRVDRFGRSWAMESARLLSEPLQLTFKGLSKTTSIVCGTIRQGRVIRAFGHAARLRTTAGKGQLTQGLADVPTDMLYGRASGQSSGQRLPTMVAALRPPVFSCSRTLFHATHAALSALVCCEQAAWHWVSNPVPGSLSAQLGTMLPVPGMHKLPKRRVKEVVAQACSLWTSQRTRASSATAVGNASQASRA